MLSLKKLNVLALMLLLIPSGWLLADGSQTAASPLKILMVLWRGETAAEQGFIDELQQQHVNLEITRINANQDRNRLAEHLWKLAPSIEQFDTIYSFGTTASVMTKTIIRGRAPQLYSMVSNPSEAGLSPDNPESPPLTGSTDAIPARLKLDIARQLFDIQSIGFLFNSREQNARVQLEELEQLCEELGIRLQILRVAPNSESLENQLARLQAGNIEIDTLYLPSDSYIISQSKVIMTALKQTPYKVIGATESSVRDGALLAIAPDYHALGRDLAQRLVALKASHFRSHLAPITVENPRIIYNEATRLRLNIQIPEALAGKMEPIQ
jgi:putative ABC transport system substrate-binding protein